MNITDNGIQVPFISYLKWKQTMDFKKLFVAISLTSVLVLRVLYLWNKKFSSHQVIYNPNNLIINVNENQTYSTSINSFDESIFLPVESVLSSPKAYMRSFDQTLALNFWTLVADLRIYFITPFVCTALATDTVSPDSSKIKQHTEEKAEPCRRCLQNFM